MSTGILYHRFDVCQYADQTKWKVFQNYFRADFSRIVSAQAVNDFPDFSAAALSSAHSRWGTLPSIRDLSSTLRTASGGLPWGLFVCPFCSFDNFRDVNKETPGKVVATVIRRPSPGRGVTGLDLA